jgi:(E)-4-hydroxy-3-methylbut-2-enyl-diphosphate synthase
VCFTILQATQRRITKAEFISCPSCGRTLFDIATVTQEIKAKLGHLTGVRIAVMGCIVNGPGEMADADYGYVGGAPGKISLYRNKEVVERNIPQEKALDALIDLIKSDGKWVDEKSS